MKKTAWKTAPISPTCHVLLRRGKEECGRPTDYAYPAWGRGWASLCCKHAAKHHPHCISIEKLIEQGERFEDVTDDIL